MSALRDLNILPYIHKNNTKIYLETGLGFGTGIIRAMQPEFGFQLLISVEINPDLVELESKFFRFDTRIHLINDNSVDGLKGVLPQLNPAIPIFFFLDAHFQNSDVIPVGGKQVSHSTGEEDIRLPLWNELKLIKELRTNRGCRDVIVCDDIFLYDRQDRYDDKVARLGEGAVPDYQRDYLPKFIELYKDTHNSILITSAQGFLVLEPK